MQKHNLARADVIACVSEYNRDDLLAFGIPAERLRVLHLPPAIHPPTAPLHQGDVVRLLFVGRFVAAKGVIDLLRAVRRLRADGVGGFRLTLVGNPLLSSPACIAEMRQMLDGDGLDEVVDIVESPDVEELSRIYAESDALVIPSYHEGYCMPVLEAMTAGCHIVAYDAGNLPYITAGLGRLVATGDVDALAGAIAEFVATEVRGRSGRGPRVVATDGGLLAEEEWRRAVSAHVARYSMAEYRRGFLDMLAVFAGRSPRGAALLDWLHSGAGALRAGAA